MQIYSRSSHAKFHPDPIWNDGVLGLLKTVPQKQKSKTSRDMESVPDPKTTTAVS